MARMGQSWNNILHYVKMRLGSPPAMLEITDDELHDYFMQHTLQKMSEEFAMVKWVTVTIDDKFYDASIEKGAAHAAHAVRMPLDSINVESIHEVYSLSGGRGSGAHQGSQFNMNPMNGLISQGYSEMSKDRLAVFTWWFRPPNIVCFELDPFTTSDLLIVEISGHYDRLNEIDADMYQIFKDLCLVDALELLIMRRTQYSNIDTPIGSIDMNVDALKQMHQELNPVVMEKIANIPPRILVDFMD